MLRDPDGGEGIEVQRQAAAERRLPKLQHGTRIAPLRGQFAERSQQCDVVTLIGEIGSETPHDVALAERIKRVGGAHAFVGKCRTAI